MFGNICIDLTIPEEEVTRNWRLWRRNNMDISLGLAKEMFGKAIKLADGWVCYNNIADELLSMYKRKP